MLARFLLLVEHFFLRSLDRLEVLRSSYLFNKEKKKKKNEVVLLVGRLAQARYNCYPIMTHYDTFERSWLRIFDKNEEFHAHDRPQNFPVYLDMHLTIFQMDALSLIIFLYFSMPVNVKNIISFRK